MINNLTIAFHANVRCKLKSLSVEILLPKYMNLSTNFISLSLRVEMASSSLKNIYFVLFAFTWMPMPPAVFSRLCSRDSTQAGVFARSAQSSA